MRIKEGLMATELKFEEATIHLENTIVKSSKWRRINIKSRTCCIIVIVALLLITMYLGL
jgi:t-SNARE complex subunit (syntaxin)